MVNPEMEKAILESIDRQEVIDLELGMTSIPSFATEEAELARFLYSYMKDMGLKTELEEVPLEAINPDFATDLSAKSTYIPIGKIKGSGDGPSLLFFGHMDHGPRQGRAYWDPSRFKMDPFKAVVKEPYIYGKGCQDDKAGICAFIIAAKAMLRAGFKPKGDIYFCPVPVHKPHGFGTLHLLHKYGLRTDYAVNSENTDMGIVPVSVGRSRGKIHIRAYPDLHFSTKERSPELRNRKTTFEQLTRFMQALGPEMMPPGPDSWMKFEVTKGLEDYPQIRVETIKGTSMGHVELSFQIRVVPGQTVETIKADLERLVKRLQSEDPHFEAEIDWPILPHNPAHNTPYDSPVVKVFAAAYKDLVDVPPLEVSAKTRIGTAADASHVFAVGIPVIQLGPGGLGSHERARPRDPRLPRVDERVFIDDIVNCAKVFAIGAARLCS